MKITNLQLIKESDLRNNKAILDHIKSIYPHINDFSLLTKVEMEKIDNSHLKDNTTDIKQLFEEGTISIAKLPEDNRDIEELFKAQNFSLAFINHDYAGITPKMRNFIAQKYGLDIKTSMVVSKAENLAKILEVLRANDRYI